MKLITDHGVEGLGEAYGVPFHPKKAAGLIEDIGERFVIGSNPFDIERMDGFHAEILKEPIQWADGYLIPSGRPGLGVELNEEVAAMHPCNDRLWD